MRIAKENIGVGVQVTCPHSIHSKILGLVNCESHDTHTYDRDYGLSKIGKSMEAERTGLRQLFYPRFVDLRLEYREVGHVKP